jgi:hypothetical protein
MRMFKGSFPVRVQRLAVERAAQIQAADQFQQDPDDDQGEESPHSHSLG